MKKFIEQNRKSSFVASLWNEEEIHRAEQEDALVASL